MANLVYTCLPASPELVALGYTTVVAQNETRVHEGAFRDGKMASAFCDKLNSVAADTNGPALGQSAIAQLVKAGEQVKTVTKPTP